MNVKMYQIVDQGRYEIFRGVGFYEKTAYYLRDGEVISFPVTDFLIGLMNDDLSFLLSSLKPFVDMDGNKTKEMPISQATVFFAVFKKAYLLLLKNNVVLCDCLVAALNHRSKSFRFDNFSILRFEKMFWNPAFIAREDFPAIVSEWSRRLYHSLSAICDMQQLMRILIPEFLSKRGNDILPSSLYAEAQLCPHNIEIKDLSKNTALLFSEVFRKYNQCRIHTIRVNDINRFTGKITQVQYKQVSFYSCTDIENIIFRSFEYLCYHDFYLTKCAICGKYFVPLTRMSRFCERPLNDGTGRVCKSLSAYWNATNGDLQEVMRLQGEYRQHLLFPRIENKKTITQRDYMWNHYWLMKVAFPADHLKEIYRVHF